MSDDLVKRLRSCANGAWLFKTKQGDFGICDDAADRIEALTAERDALIRDRDRWVAEAQVNTSPIVAGLTADNARLRKLLGELLQVQDGLPMTGLEATRRGEAARAALNPGKETK
jgi:hypothetical protein